MKFRLIPVLLLGLAPLSCEKVKTLVGKARASLEPKVAAKPAGEAAPGTQSDAELQKLVDQTADGVVFRKDLPFPTHLEVTTTRRQEVSERVTRSSALGKENAVVKGTRTTVTKCERAGDLVSYTLLESTFAEPVADPNPAAPKKPEAVAKPTVTAKPVLFQKTGGVWKADRSQGFQAMVLSQTLSPVFTDLLVDYGLSPRPLWFTGKRLKIGDQLTVTGKSLPMLVAGTASGSLKLTLKSLDAVNGHPCGVFDFSGSTSRKQVPDFDGSVTDTELTVQSGRIWLSLIYPLVLREEANAIQTTHIGLSGGPSDHTQGAVKLSISRDWKVVGK